MRRFSRILTPTTSFVLLGVSASAALPDGYIFSTFAGAPGRSGAVNATGSDARFKNPLGIGTDNSGNVLVADEGNALIRRIDRAGAVTTVAGKVGDFGYQDGPVSTARFGSQFLSTGPDGIRVTVRNGPVSVAADYTGTIYVADRSHRVIRRISSDGTVSTWAGHSPTTVVVKGVNGTGTGASFVYPIGLAVDTALNVYVADQTEIRKITPAQVVSSISIITFDRPAAVAWDKSGDLVVLDSYAYTVRKLGATGAITTLAGKHGTSGSADGFRTDARFGEFVEGTPSGSPDPNELIQVVSFGPAALALDADGTVFVADTWNHTIRRIAADGQVTTIGGKAGNFGATDGAGHLAGFHSPQGIAVDYTGVIYVADSANHTIRKGTPAYRPSFQQHPQSQATLAGQSVQFTVAVSGTPAPSLQWTKNGVALPGATGNSLSVPSAQPADAGRYEVVATNALGSLTSTAAELTVGTAPSFSTQPVARAVLGGQPVTLTVAVNGAPPFTYQWFKDGRPVSGAIGPTFTLAGAQEEDAGDYTAVATNAAGSTTSAPARVRVNTSRLVNLSIRTRLGASAPVLAVGFVVSGEDKRLLVRGVGPTLRQFGLSEAFADPKIALFAGTTLLGGNDNWGNLPDATQLATTSTQLGAFPLAPGSNDAALLRSFNGGNYTVQITGPAADASGVVLVEVYDAAARTAARLINVSTRAQVGTGDDLLVAGFAITGNEPKTLLIRAIGPTLSSFGISGALSNPRLAVIGSNQATVAANDNWSGTPTLQAAFAAQGAFPLASADSMDAAVLVTLSPGSYSVQVSGVGDTTGEALVEIYEVL